MSSNKKYWQSVEELKESSSIVETHQQKEFAQEIPTDEFLGDKETLESSTTSRRDFLKYVGFSTAAASLAACEGPVMKSIPYVVQPERIVPGVANYYATTMADGFDFAGVLVKTREGRPIKIEHNTMANTGANARVQASVLSLYDNKRLQRPEANGQVVSWEQFDKEVKEKLNNLSGEIVLLTQTFASPSTSRLINDFSQKYGNVRHVVYDTVSEDAALDAFQARYGTRALPNYDFSKAETIVSVGADFLGDWAGGGYDAAYAKGRIPKNGKMSRHVQFESNLSLSGGNADKRVPVTPSQQKMVLAALHGYVTGGASTSNLPAAIDDAVVKAARQLRKSGSSAVVVTGIPDTDAQSLVLSINEALGSAVMDTENPRMLRQGNAAQVKQLVKDMNAGQVGAILIAGVNPAYSLPFAEEFVEGLKKVDLSVAFSMKKDETALLCNYVAATPHYLESWGDIQFTKKTFTLMQPTIKPLFDTSQFQDTLLRWTDNSTSYYNYIKDTWSGSLGNTSWTDALHDGVFEATAPAVGVSEEAAGAGSISVNSDSVAARNLAGAAGEGLELELYTSTAMGSGNQANNPWLQEMPDPITRASWDNYLKISRADAAELGLENEHVANGALNGSLVNLKVGETVLKNVPVFIQPGQAKGSVALALGYGKKEGIQKEMQVGVNAYPVYKDFKSFQNVTIEKTAGVHEFACLQLHTTLMGRNDIIKETTLEIFNTKDSHVWNKMPEVSLNHVETPVTSPDVDLWDGFDRSTGHHFNMSIDLNACTGCGACVISCHAENNVPVVGKEEVRKYRDMHWLRIDRYYSSEESFEADLEKKENMSGLGDSLSQFGEMEVAADNPQVVFQPVMCQHCNHAPCETVCPVAATMHGRQGQNQMIYNRCVGTRYCANNCPYKVRRFNWFLYNKNDEFDYHMNNDLGRMVLNPDVTVRSRGVMEKCSFCIQKTQKTILDAKREGRAIEDGEFQTACSAACDKGAIIFGDVNDENSKVAELKEDDRMYHLLEYIGTKPNVMYQTKVRNTSEA
ncbi:quinol:cytochrome c oxidoreductase iron-sulfur protein precursor [Salinimicrobium catena]|uniref:Quinol:cytochrome c oxidoreductase iron-sulfur protein n=1 Tax=Salinimicrobium catena TaxID=390640 RepID=A0A1H5H8Z0_9FLAO|nr:TAT-variant-translocated molybdopterin oxidoreductase [Salinimicrobium catena]SDK68499.1 quinol:cytochrome c oxidoreductase iron-sulfur protein precursor [Salinimicrobium catena]SEE24419.1 quinol:cytochrome c oxidoreductase iron-sulfur protein precursor [Salinimicrobium catena]